MIVAGISLAYSFFKVYILPLASVVESFQVTDTTIKTIGGTDHCFHPKARSGSPDTGAYAH